MNLSILYRGPLASCNYSCGYCPFAKQRDTSAQLRADREALERFVDWIQGAHDIGLSILFTPWGEALTRPWYRDGLVTLSREPRVSTVSIQTNLSCSLHWLDGADPDRLSLWCTYHPDQASLEAFVGRTRLLDQRGIGYSVGIVGFPDHLASARSLRAALPENVYVWVNPASGLGRPYTDAEVRAWSAVDPLFPLALRPMTSRGRACRTGETVVSVDGEGDVRRCHFVPEKLGNLYDGSWRAGLAPRPCPNGTCDCFIGYVHRDADLYDSVFGVGLLGRRPLGVTGAWDPATGVPTSGTRAGSATASTRPGGSWFGCP